MRSQELHAALATHLEAVAAHLQGELAGGAEVPFELERRGGRVGARRPALYCYRPLLGEFLEERFAELEALPTHHDAARALADFEGLERYLIDRGVEPEGPPRQRLRAGLLTLMEDAFGENSDFELEPERLRSALAALQGSASSSVSEVAVLARLRGLAITSPQLQITSGLAIVREDALQAPLPDTGAILGADPGEPLFVLLCSEAEDPRAALHAAHAILAELLRGLRLFGDGRIALEALGWARISGGPWRPYQLPGGGPARGTLVVTAEQEDELRAFCNLVSRRRPEGNALAWALRRYELGCERASAGEALSDNLLALRALLEDEQSSAERFAERMAALCATPEQAPGLAVRVTEALALERSLRCGQVHPGGAEEALAGEIADHLRALLRDMICGHLQDDLIELAERIIAEAEERRREERSPGQRGQAECIDDDVDTGGTPGGREPMTAASLEEMFSHASQSEEILDVFI